MASLIYLIIYLCASGDEVEVGSVSSKPSERGATGVVSLALVSEPAAAPSLAEVRRATMEEYTSFAPQSEAAIAPDTVVHRPDEGVVIEQHIHISGNSLTPIFVDRCFFFFQSIFLSHRTNLTIVVCRAHTRKPFG